MPLIPKMKMLHLFAWKFDFLASLITAKRKSVNNSKLLSSEGRLLYTHIKHFLKNCQKGEMKLRATTIMKCVYGRVHAI